MPNEVSLKEHFDALNLQRDRYESIIKAMEWRQSEQESAWIKEKFELHNNLLQAWQLASTEDRANFVKNATFDALKDAFSVNTATTAKALTLAEGKSKGFGLIVSGAAFVCGVMVALAAVWTAVHR